MYKFAPLLFLRRRRVTSGAYRHHPLHPAPSALIITGALPPWIPAARLAKGRIPLPIRGCRRSHKAASRPVQCPMPRHRPLPPPSRHPSVLMPPARVCVRSCFCFCFGACVRAFFSRSRPPNSDLARYLDIPYTVPQYIDAQPSVIYHTYVNPLLLSFFLPPALALTLTLTLPVGRFRVFTSVPLPWSRSLCRGQSRRRCGMHA